MSAVGEGIRYLKSITQLKIEKNWRPRPVFALPGLRRSLPVAAGSSPPRIQVLGGSIGFVVGEMGFGACRVR